MINKKLKKKKIYKHFKLKYLMTMIKFKIVFYNLIIDKLRNIKDERL